MHISPTATKCIRRGSRTNYLCIAKITMHITLHLHAVARASKKVQRLKCNAQIITLPYIARSCASRQKSAMPKVQCTNNHGVAPAPHAHTQYFFVTTIVEDSSQIHPQTIHNSNTPLTLTIQKHTHKHNTNTTHTQKHTYTQTPPPPVPDCVTTHNYQSLRVNCKSTDQPSHPAVKQKIDFFFSTSAMVVARGCSQTPREVIIIAIVSSTPRASCPLPRTDPPITTAPCFTARPCTLSPCLPRAPFGTIPFLILHLPCSRFRDI